MRGLYVQGQLVYMFRRQGKGMIATRHGAWIGPGKIIGMDSSTDGPIPRLFGFPSMGSSIDVHLKGYDLFQKMRLHSES